MDIFDPYSIEETFPINMCRCCLVEGCYKDISSEYFFSGKKEIYEEMLKDVFNLEISFQKYGGPSRYSRLICENCIVKLRDAKEFKYKVLESEKSFIKYLEDMQINTKEEENNHEADIISGECAIKVEPELSTDNDAESCENDIFGNSQVVNYYDELGIKIESESNIDNEIESHGIVKDQTEENHTDVMRVKLESESNTDNEIESNETLEDYTKNNHIVTLENIKMYVNKNLNKNVNVGANVCDKRKLTTEVNTKKKKTKLADGGTNQKRRKKGDNSCTKHGSNSKDGCELDSETSKPVLPANVICDIPISILKETDDSISFVIPKGVLMPGDSISGKHELSKGKDISPFVSSSNDVDNLLKERNILDGSNNIALSLEKLKQPLSEDFHDTNITPEGKVKSPKGIVLAEDINGKRSLRKRGKCLGFYSTKQDPSHVIECDYTLSAINAQVKKQKSLLRHFKVDNNLKNIVFPLMESDTISLIAQKDKIICMFGVHYFKKYGEIHSVMTSKKMRDLAKLLVEVNKLIPKISCLEEVLKPQYYTTLVDASKNVIQYKKETQFEALTYVLNIANLLKYCCRIAISECSKLETPESVEFKEDMKALILQINRNWRQDIATLVHCSDNSDSD